MTTELAAPPPRVLARQKRNRWVVPVVALALLALWLVSLPDVDLDATGGWGLLTALPVTWYLAFVGTVLLYGGVLIGRGPVWHGLAACQVTLVALLFGTTAAVYDVPRYPWTYKHIGVVEYLLDHGTVDRSIDIYQNFPGFFYLAGALHRATGVPVETLAQWAQPVFALLTAAAVYWVVGGLSTSTRVRYGAVFVYTLGDWIGQNYFAPQALAFPLSLFVLGGLLRTVPPGPAGVRFARLARSFAANRDSDVPGPSRFWCSPWGALVLVLGFAVVAVSHPLSPVLLLLQSALICVFLRPARAWLPLVFLAIEQAWLLQAWPFLHSTYDLFDFGLSNVSPPQAADTDPLPAYQVAVWAAPVLMILVLLLVAWGVLAAAFWRARLSRVLTPLALAAVPLCMVLGQPYGNEGIFRAYLFALPWMAFIIALQFFDQGVAWTPERRLLSWLAVGAAALLALPANVAAELTYRMSPSDVAADAWFEQQTPDGSFLLPFTSSFPVRATERYAEHLPGPTHGVDGLTDLPGFSAAATDETSLVEFTRDACTTRPGDGPVYLVVGPSAEDEVRLLGTTELTVYWGYLSALEEEADFLPVYRDGETVVYRCRS